MLGAKLCSAGYLKQMQNLNNWQDQIVFQRHCEGCFLVVEL